MHISHFFQLLCKRCCAQQISCLPMGTSCSSITHHFQLPTSKASVLHVATSESHWPDQLLHLFLCKDSIYAAVEPSSQHGIFQNSHSFTMCFLVTRCGSNKHSQIVSKQQKVPPEDELQGSSEAKIFLPQLSSQKATMNASHCY